MSSMICTWKAFQASLYMIRITYNNVQRECKILTVVPKNCKKKSEVIHGIEKLKELYWEVSQFHCSKPM